MISNQYVAGFLDGEGTVGFMVNRLKSGKPKPRLRVAYANFEQRPLVRIKAKWGGSLTGPNKNGVSALHMNGIAAYNNLKAIQPYLLVKADSVKWAIKAVEWNNKKEYKQLVNCAILAMQATRAGYRAKRGSKMLDMLLEEQASWILTNIQTATETSSPMDMS